MVGINAIIEPYPNYITVGNIRYEIDTDFRTWLVFLHALQEDNEEKCVEYYLKIFPHVDAGVAPVDELIGFSKLCDQTSPEKETRMDVIQRLLDDSSDVMSDMFYDCDIIIADFMREYQINLTDPKLSMHWLHFKTLLNGLSSNSGLSERSKIRGTTDKEVAKKNINSLKHIQKALKIPANRKKLTQKQRDELMMEYGNLVYEQAQNETKEEV